MTIKILPARLANQIAAGEVVERPASVVKELVENSLDSGATRIDIDIEKGGSKLIRVRDNGRGIPKDELGLALSRHATSKIHTLDDLEAIMSLGFRGEALASISSVARLTLTSRTATQDQAWSSYSEGRDMNVKIQPSAHPIGTTVEVLDLFFNTPARRKFLRTEKTEFSHIDELLKRIALSRFDVAINLKHNGKVIRQYRAAKNDLQKEKRLAAVCGAAFVRNMLKVELEHNGLKLSGWITSPEGARQQSDLQYCYVNGRMMRDKLINHAIRQSYETTLRPDQFATYVLFIELDAHQVDVNVHPAKHEVRFHQARLVHDFIYQALAGALAQSKYIDSPQQTESAYHKPEAKPAPANQNEVQEQVTQAISDIPAYPGQMQYSREETKPKRAENSRSETSRAEANNPWVESKSVAPAKSRKEQEKSPDKAQLKAYQELLRTPDFEPSQERVSNRIEEPVGNVGKAVSVIANEYLMMTADSGPVLISLHKAEWYRVFGQLQVSKKNLVPQPLLVPLSLKVDDCMLKALENSQPLLERFGIQIKVRNGHSIMVMGMPGPLRQQNLQQLLLDLLSYAVKEDCGLDEHKLAHWLATQITQVKNGYTLSEGIQLISELEQIWEGIWPAGLPLDDRHFVQKVDFSATIAKFRYE
ncbi:DNA mismatch repair endonuclease MutL [Vibrio sp. JC009]|uniref:DNA mismatch repair endonuclease MutL n=1 Tax=Vibrio sp. JC009 TaxID=2912314 RepID=UPI0023B0A682|nr:DNA mismatch repair endonuclease MutL [Vibrio sp. JC009]WED21606.1 DNA mismatch repair endonuclease MutL [Vibrio sp. JC009]